MLVHVFTILSPFGLKESFPVTTRTLYPPASSTQKLLFILLRSLSSFICRLSLLSGLRRLVRPLSHGESPTCSWTALTSKLPLLGYLRLPRSVPSLPFRSLPSTVPTLTRLIRRHSIPSIPSTTWSFLLPSLTTNPEGKRSLRQECKRGGCTRRSAVSRTRRNKKTGCRDTDPLVFTSTE